MGRIVRCISEKAVHPMYVAVAGIHLYSLEELSFFLQNFLYLIDAEFFNSELLRFLKDELKRPDLAELVMARLSRMKPVALAGELALAAGGMSEKEQIQLRKRIEEYLKMPDSGRKKLQADALFARGAYEQAEILYEGLLQQWKYGKAGTGKLSESDAGKVYYALGKIRMSAFEWRSAGDALVHAYELLQQEFILQELYELSCISPVEVCEWKVFSRIHGITLRRWQEQFNRKKELIENSLAERDYESMQNRAAAGAEGLSEAEVLCGKWKQDFRKIRKSCCQGDIFSV